MQTKPVPQLMADAYQHYAAGDPAIALQSAYMAMGHVPDHHEAHQVAAMCEAQLGNIDTALVLQRRAIELAPVQAEYHYNLGVLQQQAGQPELAMLSYRNCLRLAPEHADSLWNYSDLLRLNEHFAPAVACLEKLLELERTNYPGIYHRLAVAYNGLGRPKAAARAFEQSLSNREPDTELTKWEYSHVLLGEGDLVRGWETYESRYLIQGDGRIVLHEFEYPRWLGEPLADKTLLIHGEQGIGDQLMFASIIPQLVSEGAALIIACHPSLCRLFAMSFPSARILPHSIGNPAQITPDQHIDYEIPICSLARWRGPQTVEQSPAQAYLQVDSNLQAQFEQQLALYRGKAKLRVGLMWSANPAKGVDWGERRALQKSVQIEQLAPLGVFADRISFVSLQNRDSGAQAAHAPALDMLDFHDQLLDFADTAALMACLNLVISVDTSVAHLAGGMDQKNFLLLKTHPDWRWLNRGDSSYWYLNTRLFRQQSKGDWTPVIQQIGLALEAELN